MDFSKKIDEEKDPRSSRMDSKSRSDTEGGVGGYNFTHGDSVIDSKGGGNNSASKPKKDIFDDDGVLDDDELLGKNRRKRKDSIDYEITGEDDEENE